MLPSLRVPRQVVRREPERGLYHDGVLKDRLGPYNDWNGRVPLYRNRTTSETRGKDRRQDGPHRFLSSRGTDPMTKAPTEKINVPHSPYDTSNLSLGWQERSCQERREDRECLGQTGDHRGNF